MKKELHLTHIGDRGSQAFPGKTQHALVIHVDAYLFSGGERCYEAAIIGINSLYLSRPGSFKPLCGQLSQVARCRSNSAGK